MLTKNDKKIIDEHIEAKIPKTIEGCIFIARKELFKPKNDFFKTKEKQMKEFEEAKQQLIKRGFKYIKTESLGWSFMNDEYEIWEKEYGKGEF